jgi:hypothetical protein
MLCHHPRPSRNIDFFNVSLSERRSQSSARCDDAPNVDPVKAVNCLANYSVSSSSSEFSPHFTFYRPGSTFFLFHLPVPLRADSRLLLNESSWSSFLRNTLGLLKIVAVMAEFCFSKVRQSPLENLSKRIATRGHSDAVSIC